jgi:hypothetical protein
MIKHLLLLFLSICCQSSHAQAARYAVVRGHAPVLNIPAFSSIFGGADRKSLKTDGCGQVRELEFIALPGTVVSIRSTVSDGNRTIFRITSDDYPMPPNSALYLDSRFVEIQENKPSQRVASQQSRLAIIDSLKAAVGEPYVWGGNVQNGISELVGLYYGGSVPDTARNHLTLAGLDCSGLLYQATGGATPRNTSRLVFFGNPVAVAGKTLEEIAGSLEPLDLIVWSGHVIIVLDRETTIESRLECGKKGTGGVVTTALRKRLKEVMKTRRPVDDWPKSGNVRNVFVVRRWFLQ